MNGTFTYSSGSATGFTPTFDEMVAGTIFALTPAGPVSFKKLASATTVTITTSYATKITSLDMSALTSVTSFNTGTVNQLHLSSATNIDLGALPRYGTALSIQTKKGATLDIGLLDDVTTLGVLAPMTLTLNGPDSVTLSKIDDGTITLSNVGTATVSGFYGILDIDAGVETLTTTDSVFIALDGATDLVTATLDYKYDWDPALTTANAAISAAGYSATYLDDYATSASIGGTDLKTLTITGDLLDLYLDEANLETLSINANMTDLTMQTLTDLTSLTVAGGKIGNIKLDSSPNISVANFDHTSNMENKGSATANKSVSFVVTDNLGLTKLHTTGDLIHTFTVTGNDALTELDMTGVKTRGTETTGGSVNIWDNDLTAVKSTNTEDAETSVSTTTGADGGSLDAGNSDDGTSGMDTMKIYLTAIAADGLNTAQVNFDTVSTFDESETTTTTTYLNTLGSTTNSATTNRATVLKMTPAVANSTPSNAVAATTGKRALAITTGGQVQFTINSVSVPATAYTLLGNGAVDALNIASQANKDLASAAGVNMDVLHAYSASAQIVLTEIANDATTDASERYTDAQVTDASTTTGNLWTVGIEDLFTLNVGSNSVTVSPGSISGNATTLAGLEAMFISAWADKYGSAGTASWSAIATLAATGGAGTFVANSMQKDSGGNGLAVSITISDETQATGNATRTSGNIGLKYGATAATTDNVTIPTTTGGGLIVTFESKLSGVTDAILTGVATKASSSLMATFTELTTSYKAETGITSYALASNPRTDVVTVYAAVANSATSNATAAVNYNRVTWLG
jgi:hypothetical protein